jgi:hypothetical protein
MKKKLLASLLVASIALTGLFAYTAPSVILEAVQAELPFVFILQYNDTGNTSSQTVSNLVLDSTGGTTGIFTLETNEKANSGNRYKFTTNITTGEFLGEDTAGIGWYPVIIEKSIDIPLLSQETVSFDFLTEGTFNTISVGSFEKNFKPGKHVAGTEIARFQLQYQGDDEIIAGSYRSTTTLEIIGEEQ